MGDIGSEKSSKLSRRDFLKLSGAVAGVVALSEVPGASYAIAMQPRPDSGPKKESKETGRWQKDRFFEDIEGFDAAKFLEVRADLLQFGDKNEALFRSMESTLEFDKQEWVDGVKKSTNLLRRMQKTYKQMKDSGQLNAKEEELIKRDFYDSASVVWAFARVSEKFKNDPEGFKNALIYPTIKTEEETDPLLGSEISSINSSWACTLDYRYGNSRLIRIINDCDVYDHVQNPWWQDIKGPEGLLRYKKALDLPKRPAQISVDVDIGYDEAMESRFKDHYPEELGARILESLKSERLDRVGIDLSVIKSDSWFGGYTPIEVKDPDQIRDIVIGTTGNPTKRNFETRSYLIDGIPVHEGWHAVWDLIPFMKSDIDVMHNRARIEEMLDMFRPQTSLQRLFQPHGQFYTGRANKKSDYTYDLWNARHGVVNMSTMTEYAARTYSEVDSGFVYSLMYDTSDIVGKTFVYDIFRSDFYSEGENTSNTFVEEWEHLMQKLEANHVEQNIFERMVLDKISQNVSIFDAPERPIYFLKTNWRHYIEGVVFPLVITQLYREDPDKFKSAFLQSVDRPELNGMLTQAVDDVFLAATGKKYRPESDQFTRGDSMSDAELFCDIGAYNHLRKRKDVKNEIPESVWAKVQPVYDGIIDDLIKNELAVVPASFAKM
jgi:hypothetical protein